MAPADSKLSYYPINEETILEIKDTKYQLKDLAKRYSCEKGEYEAHNIMDYAYCFYNEITLEQRKRIRHILNYSPLIPGPKESRIDTRGVQGRLNLPICIMK